MSDPEPVLLGRAELERAFTRLGERLLQRGVVADVYIVGGAAMALAYDAERVTRDVDAVFSPHSIVVDEAQHVAAELGLPRWWLNEQARVYISTEADPGKRRVFDHPGLRVMAASPQHIFAMKALAARRRDIPGIDSLQAAMDDLPRSTRTSNCRSGLSKFCGTCSNRLDSVRAPNERGTRTMPRFQVAGNDFSCQLCAGAEFADRRVKLNTGAMSFFDLDWLNKSADGLICENCGYLHMFFKKDVVQPADLGAGTP